MAQTQQLSQKEADNLFAPHASHNQNSHNEETINVDPAQTDKLISVSQSNPTSKDKTFYRPRASHSKEMSQEVLNKIKEIENIVSLAQKNNESTRDVVFWARMIEKKLGQQLHLVYRNITKDVFLSIMKGFFVNIQSERIKGPETFGKIAVDLIRRLFKELEMQHNYKINVSNLDKQDESITMSPDHVSTYKSPTNPKSNQSQRGKNNMLTGIKHSELDPFRGRSPSFPIPPKSSNSPVKEDKG